MRASRHDYGILPHLRLAWRLFSRAAPADSGQSQSDELIDRLWREIRAGELALDPSPKTLFDLVIIVDRLKVAPEGASPIDADDFQVLFRVDEIFGPYTQALKPGDTLDDLYRSILRDKLPADAVKTSCGTCTGPFYFHTEEEICLLLRTVLLYCASPEWRGRRACPRGARWPWELLIRRASRICRPHRLDPLAPYLALLGTPLRRRRSCGSILRSRSR